MHDDEEENPELKELRRQEVSKLKMLGGFGGSRQRKTCPTCSTDRWYSPGDEKPWGEHILPGSHRINREQEDKCGALEKMLGVDA